MDDVAMSQSVRILNKDGVEVARVTADSISFGKKAKTNLLTDTDLVDDPRMVKMVDADGVTAFVLMVSSKYTSERVG